MTKISSYSLNTSPTLNDSFLGDSAVGPVTYRYSLTQMRAAMMVDNTTADANGWVKKDFGNFQIYEQTFTFGATSLTAGASNIQIFGSIGLPTGITNLGQVRSYVGYAGSFGGNFRCGIDIATSAPSSMTTFNITGATNFTATVQGAIYVALISL